MEEAHMSAWKWVAVVIVLSLTPSCSSDRAQRRPYLIMENMDNAARHIERGEAQEAAQIYQLVLLADPSNEKAEAALADIGEYDRCILEPGVLGKNLVTSPKRESRSLWLLMYPVNRVLDVLDVVSVHVGLEGGLYADAHATRAAQVALGAGGGMQLGWWQKRELAAGAGYVAGMALGPFSLEVEGLTRAGTRGARRVSVSPGPFNRPSDPTYQRHRDYWGVGLRTVALIVGAEVEIHPVELADAACGFFFVDFLRDDIGRTRSLRLTRADVEAMEDLIGTLSASELRARTRGRAAAPPESDEDRAAEMSEEQPSGPGPAARESGQTP